MKDPRSLWIDLAGFAVCVVLTLGAFLAGIRPMQAARSQQQLMRDELRTAQNDADRLAELASAAEQRYAEARHEQQMSDFVLLGPKDRLQRLKGLSDLAAQAGLIVLRMDPEDPKVTGQHMAYPIRLTGRGEFTDAAKFLAQLHAEYRDVRVLKCRLTRGQAQPTRDNPETTGPTSQFEFGLVWFADRDGSIVTVPDQTP